VPSPAVHTVGANHTVTLLTGGTPTATRVETGAVGATLTEITSGLNAGDEVMLADLNQPLPSTTAGLRGIGGAGGGARPGG
jgi:hypothetical protein